MNIIALRMDPYVPKDLQDFGMTTPSYVSKEYHFERFDDDIINSPISRKIGECDVEIRITSKQDIKALIAFLKNLEPALE